MNDTSTESALLARVRAGDAEALGELFARFAGVVHRAALHLTGSAADADDVVQDVFVALPEALRGYEVRVSLSGWIRKVAVRAALTRLRRSERRREDRLDEVHEPARADREIERLEVERLIARLPATLRTVLVLKEIEGYSHGEIGRLLGISESASEVRLYRAKQLLRKQLRDP